MSEDEVLYSEVKFTKHEGTADGTASSPTDSEVRILSTQPSSELPGSQQQLVPNGRHKLPPERAAFVVLVVLLAAAIIALGLTYFSYTVYSYKNMELQIQTLTDELEAVGKNLTAYEEIFKNLTDKLDGQKKNVTDGCEDGWEQRGEECYYFSTDQMTWEASRRACGCRGGALVRIGSKEEQEYLKVMLRQKKLNRNMFWIGLTDVQEEGAWLWTDGSPLVQSLKFWKGHEPDNYTQKDYPEGEDCAAMEDNFWFDQPCRFTHKHICDKPAQTSRSKCVSSL
ncbi:immune-related, lectin-like receptor 4 [Clinocottus analis]|uniref:immune-related, lectin-like receptor 4 n=1 Tax=Clinocottus analis TaxID=304258 RepID=UPI0035BF3661